MESGSWDALPLGCFSSSPNLPALAGSGSVEHIAEMIQLEHGTRIDNHQYVMLKNDEEADELECHWDEYSDIKAIYMSQNVLLTAAQEALFDTVEVHTIPDCYFSTELREAGELW